MNPSSQRWPIPDNLRQQIVVRQIRDAIRPESTAGDANRAARLVLAMDKQNQEEESKAKDLADAELMQAMAELANLRTQQLNDDETLELARLRALFADLNASPVRPPGQSRPLENGKASGAHRS